MVERMRLENDRSIVQKFEEQKRQESDRNPPLMEPDAWLRTFEYWEKEFEDEIAKEDELTWGNE